MKECYFTFNKERFPVKFNCSTKDHNNEQVCEAQWYVYVLRTEIVVEWKITPNHPEGSGFPIPRLRPTHTGKLITKVFSLV